MVCGVTDTSFVGSTRALDMNSIPSPDELAGGEDTEAGGPTNGILSRHGVCGTNDTERRADGTLADTNVRMAHLESRKDGTLIEVYGSTQETISLLKMAPDDFPEEEPEVVGLGGPELWVQRSERSYTWFSNDVRSNQHAYFAVILEGPGNTFGFQHCVTFKSCRFT